MEFRRFLNTLILLPCQILRTGRKIVYRLLGYNDWLKDFLATWERIRRLKYAWVRIGYIWKMKHTGCGCRNNMSWFSNFSLISPEKELPPEWIYRGWSISPDERSKNAFWQKKRFKILLEIDQIYGDGRGFQNLACFRTSTIGFPTVVAALSWVDDVIKAKRNKDISYLSFQTLFMYCPCFNL